MAEPYLSQIQPFGFNWAPRMYSNCDGQILAINTNQSLFSLLGCTFGGDCRTTFGLPDLRGRITLHAPGGNQIGHKGGQTDVTLTTAEIPNHNHLMNCDNAPGTQDSASGGFYAEAPQPQVYHDVIEALTPMNSGVLAPAGGGQSHNNMQPFLVINYTIAVQGLFPSRN